MAVSWPMVGLAPTNQFFPSELSEKPSLRLASALPGDLSVLERLESVFKEKDGAEPSTLKDTAKGKSLI